MCTENYSEARSRNSAAATASIVRSGAPKIKTMATTATSIRKDVARKKRKQPEKLGPKKGPKAPKKRPKKRTK